MGFGSYDESEQENQEVSTGDDNAGVSVHENTHDGESTFEAGTSTEGLIDRLGEIKDDEDDEDDE